MVEPSSKNFFSQNKLCRYIGKVVNEWKNPKISPPVNSGFFSVSFHGGTVALSSGDYAIEYKCTDNDSCTIWQANPNSKTCITLLCSPSGSGKTTLIEELYDVLKLREKNESYLSFDFSPNIKPLTSIGIGFIPQHPPMINHLRVDSLLPKDSIFLSSFFRNEEVKKLLSLRIGQLSGGMRRRLYTCSALERLFTRKDNASFLLLDETFDGLGIVGFTECVKAFRTCWNEHGSTPLYVLLITHLDPKQISNNFADRTLTLDVVYESPSRLIVGIEDHT